MSLLHLEGVTQDYQGLAVLGPINLRLEEGEHLGILGPSGCGKSTLLRLITGLENPASGRILHRGQDLTGKPGHLAFMGQADLLLPWKRLWENAGLPLLLRNEPRPQVRAQVLGALKEMGLEGFEDYYPHQLSGGMRQRAAFLRTSLANRDLMLLDEPFAALDVLTRTQLQGWLAQVLAHRGSTLVLVTHSVEEALLLCQRIIVLSPAPGEILMEEPVAASQVPFGEKPYQSEFLAQKKRILAALQGGLPSF